MNGLMIVVIIVLGGFMLHGYLRGFIRILFSLVSLILTIGLVSFATPHVTEVIKNNTSLYETLKQTCTDKIKMKSDEEVTKTAEEKKETEETKTAEEKKDSKESEISFAGIQLPKILQEQLMSQTTQKAGEVLEQSGIYERAGEYMADLILNGIAFFAALILVSILLHFILGVLDVVARLPVIKGLNKLLGLAAGLLQGLIFVWLFLFFIAMISTSDLGQQVLGMIKGNPLLTFLYDHNGIVLFLNSMFS